MRIRLLARHQRRLALTNPLSIAIALIAIALGVTSIVTVHQVSVAIRATVAGDDLFRAYDYAIVSSDDGAPLNVDDYFASRSVWRSGGWPRVIGMMPMIEGTVELGGQRVTVVGFEPLADFELGGTAEGGSGAPGTRLLTMDHVLLPASLLEALMDAEYRLGEIVVTAEIMGSGQAIVADLYTAQRILDRPDSVDSIWLRATPPAAGILVWIDRVLPGIAAFVDSPLELDGVSVLDRNTFNPLARFADAIVFNMGALGAVSLLVAAFLVYQTVISRIARQERDRERFEMMGIPGGWIGSLQGFEIVLIATTAAMIGLAAGMWLAETLATGVGVTTGGVDFWMVAKALVAGPGVALLACLLAMRAHRSHARWVSSVVYVGAAVVALLIGGLLFGFLALLLLCFVQIRSVTPLASHGVKRLAGRLPGLRVRMTLRALTSRIDEVHLAVGALSVAVATAVGMGLMVESLRTDFLDVLEDRLWPGVYLRDARPGDLAVVAGATGATFSRAEIREHGRAEVSLVGHGRAELTVATWDAAEAGRYGLVYESIPAGPTAFVSESLAQLNDLGVSDSIVIKQGDAELPVSIGAVFRDFGSPLPRLILPRAIFEASRLKADWEEISIRLPGDTRALTAIIGEALPHVNVSNHAEIRAVALDVFDRTFLLSEALTVVALTVAVIGLIGSLNVLQMARQQEFGLLHAMGFSRGSVVSIAWSQSLVLGGMATFSAVPLGIVIGWVLCEIVNPAAFGWSVNLRLDSVALVNPVLLALLGSAVAGVAPAYRVAR